MRQYFLQTIWQLNWKGIFHNPLLQTKQKMSVGKFRDYQTSPILARFMGWWIYCWGGKKSEHCDSLMYFFDHLNMGTKKAAVMKLFFLLLLFYKWSSCIIFILMHEVVNLLLKKKNYKALYYASYIRCKFLSSCAKQFILGAAKIYRVNRHTHLYTWHT